MARDFASWLPGGAVPPPDHGGEPEPVSQRPLSPQRAGYPGQTLGLPQRGPGSLTGMGRRFAALLVDWLVAYGLAALAATLGLVPPPLLSTAVMVIWLALGAVAVALFGFTAGQFMLGLLVMPVQARTGQARVGPRVGLGRAVLRGLMIALIVPALFVDEDGRGLQDRLTGTAVVRR